MLILLRKLILSRPRPRVRKAEGAFKKRIRNIKSIWENEQDDDVGIEKLFRLFLAVSQLFFLGTYIKEFAGRLGNDWEDISIDFFILAKLCLPICILYFGLMHEKTCYYLVCWQMTETLLYVPTLIFASDIFSRPRSYRRSMLLLFLNYFEIILDFGVLYAAGQHLNRTLEHWFDPIYFSFITSASIGYGDYYPITGIGKLLVCAQSVVFLLFIVLFLNFFTSKIQISGYFGDNESQ